MRFELGGVSYMVSAEEANGSLLLAERVAALCAMKFRGGAGHEEVDAFREDLLKQCSRMGTDAPDAPYDSEAWWKCQASYSGSELVVNFAHSTENVKPPNGKDGSRDPGQSVVEK